VDRSLAIAPSQEKRKMHITGTTIELTQEFFARLPTKEYLTLAEPRKGKFRSFLLVGLNHLLSDEHDKANRLCRNNGNSNSWLVVNCVGTSSPRLGTGAKVHAKATIRGKEMWQLRLIDCGGTCLGGQSFEAHFGLGLGDAVLGIDMRFWAC
jgi:hypothetical protein